MIEETFDFPHVIETVCNFLQAKVGKFSEESYFHKSVVLEGIGKTILQNQLIIGGVMATKKKFLEKLDQFILTGDDVQNILIPAKEEEAEYYVLGKISFKTSSNLSGDIDFLRKYVGKVVMKEFLETNYRLSYGDEKYKLKEIACSWQTGIRLVALSVYEYETDPATFIKERIKK